MTGSEQNDEEVNLPPKVGKVDELEHYSDREDFAWAQESNELQLLAWHLKYRHEEARLRRRNALIFAGIGYVLVALVALVAIYVIVASWASISKLGGNGSIPDNLWELLLLTTSTTLLLGAPAGLLLRMAGVYQRDSESRSQEMDFVRNVETALRLALASKTAGVAAEAFRHLADQLAPKSSQETDQKSSPVEAKTVIDVAEKALEAVKELAQRMKPSS